MDLLLEKLLKAKEGTIEKRRIEKYISQYAVLSRMVNESLTIVFKDMDKTHNLVSRLDTEMKSAHTKKDYKIMIKMLWKLANGLELEDSPKEIRWIKTTIKRRDRELPKGLVTDIEYNSMLRVANIRDKAILFVIAESGMRNGELIRLQKDDLSFEPEGVRIRIPAETKTGSRSILCIDCVPALAAWLSQHPIKSESAPLFVGTSGRYGSVKYHSLTLEGINKIIKTLAKKAGIKRRIYAHLFRHTAATRLAKHLTESELKVYFGWQGNSQMAGTYVHLAGRDIDNSIIKAHGKPG